MMDKGIKYIGSMFWACWNQDEWMLGVKTEKDKSISWNGWETIFPFSGEGLSLTICLEWWTEMQPTCNYIVRYSGATVAYG